MAEYIELEAAIELLKQRLYETALNSTGFNADAGDVYADAAERLEKTWINELPAADVRPKWIPVTERLPKMIDGENISKEVYVTDGTDIAEACIMRDYEGDTNWTYTGIGKITHWCEQIPLPQPPKEEKIS